MSDLVKREHYVVEVARGGARTIYLIYKVNTLCNIETRTSSTHFVTT